MSVVCSWNGKELELLLSSPNLCQVSLMSIFSSTWLPIHFLGSQGKFFAPGYGEGDDEMTHRYDSQGLLFWRGHPRVGT